MTDEQKFAAELQHMHDQDVQEMEDRKKGFNLETEVPIGAGIGQYVDQSGDDALPELMNVREGLLG